MIDLIIDLAEDAAKEPFDFQAPDYSELYAAVKKAGEKDMRKAFAITDKQERTSAVAAARDAIKASLSEEQLEDANLGSAMKKLEASILRGDCGENRQADRRSRDRHDPADLSRKPGCCHGPTVRPCSPAARRKVWW